jgi:hypothetical protein
VLVTASEPPPNCGECCIWNFNLKKCVSIGCGICCDCINCECVPKLNGCQPCYKCVDCSCEPCSSYNCESCINGKCKVCNGDPNLICCDYGVCCNTKECYECGSIPGTCKNKCDPNTEFCCDGTCCTNGRCCIDGECRVECWKVKTVPKYDSEGCPDCVTCCVGDVTHIQSYDIWVLTSGSESGFCKNPSIENYTVGYDYQCTEDWDVSQILACAISAGITCSVTNIPGCISAILSTGVLCGHEGICGFVDDCIEGDQIHPKLDDIVDPNGDKGGMCHY